MTYRDQPGFMPSDEWRTIGIHWHAYVTPSTPRAEYVANDRLHRLDKAPTAVLYTPDEVAQWIEKQTIEYSKPQQVYVPGDQSWVAIGDQQDLSHTYYENALIAARGDSIYTDIYAPEEKIRLYLEAVTVEECTGH